MFWLIPIIAATAGGIAGFLFGEKKKGEEIEAKLKSEYYKCIQTLVKTRNLKPIEAYRYCSYNQVDISVAKVFILSASLIAMGLTMYVLSNSRGNKMEITEENYVGSR